MASGLTSQRGARRLLWDCETVGRSLDLDGIPARRRLEARAFGEDITTLLLATLQEADPATPHEDALRRAAHDAA